MRTLSRINEQYRICFRWSDTRAVDVEIVDYHYYEDSMTRELRLPKYRLPTPPGRLLLAEFIEPLGLTVTAFAKHIGIGRDRVSEIIHGRRRVTPDTAMRLSIALGTSVQFWLNAQLATDLYAAQSSANRNALKKIKRISSRSSAA